LFARLFAITGWSENECATEKATLEDEAELSILMGELNLKALRLY
jgi:hypothetical protein